MAVETDPHRLQQRQKQIDFGLSSLGHSNYIAWLGAKKELVKPIPLPNIHARCSKHIWDEQLKAWRRLLHLWDNVELPTGTAQDDLFRDPCSQENDDLVDNEEEGDDEEEISEHTAASRWPVARQPWHPVPNNQFYMQHPMPTSQVYVSHPAAPNQLLLQSPVYTSHSYPTYMGIVDNSANYSNMQPMADNSTWQASNTTAMVPFGAANYYQLPAANTSQMYQQYPQAVFSSATQTAYVSGSQGRNKNYNKPMADSSTWQASNTTAMVPFGAANYYQLPAANTSQMYQQYPQAVFSSAIQTAYVPAYPLPAAANTSQMYHQYQQGGFPAATQAAYAPEYWQPTASSWSSSPPPPRGSWNARPNRSAPPRPRHSRHDLPTPTQHVATQEAAARAAIVAAEGAAIQEVLLQKYRSALVAASTAHRQLALGPATSESEPQRHWSDAEYTTLLTDNFDASQPPTGILGSGALPPSLAAPAPHHSSPASDAGRGHTDLRLDEERYSNFRRHFRESPSPEPLDTPPPCWSPARLTPSLSGARGPPSSTSPGLTPSPAVWSSAQRSPGPVSALAFADWTPTQAFAPGTTFGTAAPEGQE